MRPFVEVAQHDARAGDIYRSEQVLIHQPDCLCSALAVRCTEMNVEYMEKVMSDMDVGPEHAPRFATWHGEIDLSDQPEVKSAESHISVDTAAMLASLSDRVYISELGCQITGLMLLDGSTLVVDHFLECDYIRVQFAQNPSNALDSSAPIESASLMNVVSGNATFRHRGPLDLILDQGRNPFPAFLP
jgi:hypothetical protein